MRFNTNFIPALLKAVVFSSAELGLYTCSVMEKAEITVGFRDLSPVQRQMVRSTLQSLLDSHYFSKSKRYPALLEYAVHNTLEGNAGKLKERAFGAEVFGRPADYDTSNDPVVRIAAGEVRKRIELYFSQHPEAPVRIVLPVGSYTAEFHFRSLSTDDTPPRQPQTDAIEVQDHAPPGSGAVHSESKNKGWGAWMAGRGLVLAAMLLLMVAGLAVWRYLQNRGTGEFWWPVLHNDVPALIVLGGGPDPNLAGNGATGANSQELKTLAMDNAIAAAQICSVFREYERDCKVTPAQSATLADLRYKSVALVGAFDNAWTQRLMAPLRYQFQIDAIDSPAPTKSRMIVDRDHMETTSTWRVGSGGPALELGKEYAIVGRFRSDITDGMVVVVAGLGPAGTNSAGEYVCSPEKLHEILSLAPKEWKGFNFEAVLQIEVVQGKAGHAKVVATQFW